MTPIHALLEKLSEFSTPQIIGISMGMGILVLSLFCAAGVLSYCCCGGWHCLAKVRGRVTHPPPRTAQPSEDLCQAARPPGPSQAVPSNPIHQTTSSEPILQDQIAERSLDLLRNKVMSLAALSSRQRDPPV